MSKSKSECSSSPALLAAYERHLGGVAACSPHRYQMALEQIAFDTVRRVDGQFMADIRELEKSLPCPLD